MKRQEILDDIAQQPEVSVLIIGAGVNGIGTFWDLAHQGVDVLLVDRADFCSGASAASSHMAHGGIRYLENGEFRLVREAVHERNRMLRKAPHYVKQLPTTIPIFKYFSGLFNAPLKFLNILDSPAERGAAVIKAGLIMYDAYADRRSAVPSHTFENRRKSLQRFPKINPKIVHTATYYDAFISQPERLCIELMLDAEAVNLQARSLNYASAVGAAGDIVRIQDEVSGETFDIRPQVVINAAGPWIDLTNNAMGRPTNFIGGTKGSHLVLDHPELRAAIGDSEMFFENDDGRIVLICPYLDRVLVGTSDLFIDDPDDAICSDDEIAYFFDLVDNVFPSIQVDRSHIVYTYSGVRPLPSSEADSTGQISRDHSIKESSLGGTNSAQTSPPVFNLIGGKWTTFRAFAEQVADRTLEKLERPRKQSTCDLSIGGGQDYPFKEIDQQKWIQQTANQHGLTVERVQQLFDRYGTRAAAIAAYIAAQSASGTLDEQPLTDGPTYSRGEIAFIAAHEKIVKLDDLVTRRSLLAMLGRMTPAMLTEIADVVADTLKWTEEEKIAQIHAVRERLLTKHRIDLSKGNSIV